MLIHIKDQMLQLKPEEVPDHQKTDQPDAQNDREQLTKMWTMVLLSDFPDRDAYDVPIAP